MWRGHGTVGKAMVHTNIGTLLLRLNQNRETRWWIQLKSQEESRRRRVEGVHWRTWRAQPSPPHAFSVSQWTRREDTSISGSPLILSYNTASGPSTGWKHRRRINESEEAEADIGRNIICVTQRVPQTTLLCTVDTWGCGPGISPGTEDRKCARMALLPAHRITWTGDTPKSQEHVNELIFQIVFLWLAWNSTRRIWQADLIQREHSRSVGSQRSLDTAPKESRPWVGSTKRYHQTVNNTTSLRRNSTVVLGW